LQPILPILRGIHERHQEIRQISDFEAIEPHAAPGIHGQMNAPIWFVLAECFERDAEGGSVGQERIEEVDRKIAGQSTIAKQHALHDRWPALLVGKIAPIERYGREQDRKTQTHSRRNNEWKIAIDREPVISRRILFGGRLRQF
jgi:hypothetical protein